MSFMMILFLFRGIVCLYFVNFDFRNFWVWVILNVVFNFCGVLLIGISFWLYGLLMWSLFDIVIVMNGWVLRVLDLNGICFRILRMYNVNCVSYVCFFVDVGIFIVGIGWSNIFLF